MVNPSGSSLSFILAPPLWRPLRPTAMSHAVRNLDSFRSTRSRITKRTLISPQRVLASAPDGRSRDFSHFLGDQHPLRVIFIGHNPSEKSWAEAAPYAHKSNRFWVLLKESGMVDAELAEPKHFTRLPAAVGIGFADLFVASGSDASKINHKEGESLRRDVMSRLMNGTGDVPPKIICCVSKIVAKKLLDGWSGDYGRAGTGKDWGLKEASTSEIWVLPSTSGRAGLTREQRLKPFQELAQYIAGLPWPTTVEQLPTTLEET